jgi:hypothetical protein
LREGEAALEANFGNHVHKDAVQFHAIDGLVRAVPKHHEKKPAYGLHAGPTDDSGTKHDADDEHVPELPSKYRFMRPTTPERRNPPVEVPKGVKKRRHGWDPDMAPSNNAAVSAGQRYALSFTPPPSFDRSKIMSQLIRMLNVIQGRLPPTLEALDFIILHGSDDPRFFGNMTDFGIALARFSRESKLSLLSYGSFWYLQIDDMDIGDKQATVFLKVILLSDETEPKDRIGKKDREDDKENPGKGDRSRSPPPRGKPVSKAVRPVFQPSGSGPSSSLSKDSATPAIDCTDDFLGSLVPIGVQDQCTITGSTSSGPLSLTPQSVTFDQVFPLGRQVFLGLSEPTLEPWHSMPLMQLMPVSLFLAEMLRTVAPYLRRTGKNIESGAEGIPNWWLCWL